MNRFKRLPLIVCLTLCVSPPTRAADQDGQEKPPPPPVRRIYDVAELVRGPQVDADTSAVLPPTELSSPRRPQGRSGNSGPSGREPTAPQSQVDELTKLIQSSVDPAAWRNNGGSEASLDVYGTRLVITASAADHALVAELLADLRHESSRSVRLRATWAALSEDELRTVLVPPPAKDDNGAGVRIVDLAAVDRIKGAVRYRAELNTLNGQRVNVTAGRARSVLSGFDAVVGNAAAAMEPTIDLVLAGAALQVRPVLSADSTAVTLDLRAVVSRWDPSDAPPLKIPQPVASSQPAGSVPPFATRPAPPIEVERLNMPVQLLATAVKMPTGRAALIGGMTADSGAQDDRRPLYLIIEAWASSSGDIVKQAKP